MYNVLDCTLDLYLLCFPASYTVLKWRNSNWQKLEKICVWDLFWLFRSVHDFSSEFAHAHLSENPIAPCSDQIAASAIHCNCEYSEKSN